MPTTLQEAFKSPYHKSNPASQFYNLSSYTRSSSNDSSSLRNEAEHSDFNSYYYLGGLKNGQNSPNNTTGQNNSNSQNNSNGQTNNNNSQTQSQYIPYQNSDQMQPFNQSATCLPQYNPPNGYPPLHPNKDRSSSNWLPSYQPKRDNDTDSSGSIRNPSLSSENAVSHTPPYLTGKPMPPNFCGEKQYKPTLKKTDQSDENNCNDLIDQVLSNQKCRNMLKKLLTDNEEIENKHSSFSKKKQLEGFNDNISPDINQNTIKTILIYSLGGLLLLCVFDFCFKLGQILAKKTI